MDPKLQQLFDSTEKRRNTLVQSLADYPEQALNTCPEPNKWSAIQVMHHLILSEANTLNYLRKKVLGLASARKTGFSAAFKTWLMKVWLATSFLKRKAAPATASGPEADTLAHTAEKWTETRQQLKALLDELPEGAAERDLFRHPVAGKLNLIQMLDFLDAHFRHHERQIWNALKK